MAQAKIPYETVAAAVAAANGNLAEAAAALGITRQAVQQRMRRGDVPPGKRGRPKGSRNPKRVPKLVENRNRSRFNGPRRPDKSGLQIPGTYSLAQQQLRRVLAERGAKNRVGREIGYMNSAMLGWLCDGSYPRPSLYVAVELEKRFGIRPADWFAPPQPE